MGFTSTKFGVLSWWGNMKITYGKGVSADGSTGGNVDTGLRLCYMLIPIGYGSSVVADDVTVNEDFSDGPLDGSAITIVTTANTSFYWVAIGK